jgi:DMSO/TMAO reductase YedYZ molybdopterin-dependent catalytic subunit
MRIIAVATVLSLLACSPRSSPGGVVEVRDYQGEKLSSISGFRENSINGPQRVDSAAYRLKVTGLVQRPLEKSLEQLAGFRVDKRRVRLNCVEGWSVVILWEGIHVMDLLDSTGVDSGATTVIFHAVDGYTTSLPLAFVKEHDLLLAHRMNGVVLPAARGYPFELVAENKWGYKWIRWVDGISLGADTTYRGFWESRGYSNDGSESGPMFDRR